MWHLVLAAWLDNRAIEKREKILEKIALQANVSLADAKYFCQTHNINPEIVLASKLALKQLKNQKRGRHGKEYFNGD